MCDCDNMYSNVDDVQNNMSNNCNSECDLECNNECDLECNNECDADMFTKKALIIPEYVLEDDIPDIYHYFDYYNIANLKNVTFHPDNKIMYENPTTGDPEFYGYAKIEVEKWENNVTSRNFYNNIINKNCKMVYDDPEFWDVMFDRSEKPGQESLHEQLVNESDDVPVEVPVNAVIGNDPYNDEPDHDEPDHDEPDHDEPVDDELDDEPEDEVEFNYEYYYKSYEAPQTRSKTKAKTNPGNDKMLTEIIVKKNKNYLKNNKRKEYKNVWSRRLRQKLVT